MLRFLWFDDVGKKNLVLLFSSWSHTKSCCSNRGNNHHITHYLLTELVTVETLANGSYVDDFTCGASSIEEGLEIYQKAKHLMKQ